MEEHRKQCPSSDPLDEEATIEWLVENGAEKLDEPLGGYGLFKDFVYDSHYMVLITDNCIGWGLSDSFYKPRTEKPSVVSIGGFYNPFKKHGAATKRQVIKLCEGLDIPFPNHNWR